MQTDCMSFHLFINLLLFCFSSLMQNSLSEICFQLVNRRFVSLCSSIYWLNVHIYLIRKKKIWCDYQYIKTCTPTICLYFILVHHYWYIFSLLSSQRILMCRHLINIWFCFLLIDFQEFLIVLSLPQYTLLVFSLIFVEIR